VGIGNQVVNGNVRPLSLSNGISNGIDNGISNNRAVPVGSAPFIRSAQGSGVQPTTTFRKFSG